MDHLTPFFAHFARVAPLLTWVINGKSPVNDGLPKEFYLFFLNSITEDLIQCYDCCLEEESLTTSQRQAIITLVQKPGKDHIFIKSWNQSAY